MDRTIIDEIKQQIKQEMQLYLDSETHHLHQKIKYLQDEIYFLKNPAPKNLPYSERFPPLETIVRLQAQLFVNAPKQGVTTHQIKVYLWDRPEARTYNEIVKFKDGYYMPFVFSVRPAIDYVKQREWDPEGFDLRHKRMGHLVHKGKKRGDGTIDVLDHVAVLHEDMWLDVFLDRHPFKFGCGTPAKPSANPKAPRHIWYLDIADDGSQSASSQFSHQSASSQFSH